MIEFKLPSLGADMDEGTLLQWRVLPGDSVKRGQVVAVVDTSKAAVDVEIWQDGVVAELLTQPGEKIPVGTVMARLRERGVATATMTTLAAEPERAKAAPTTPLPAADRVPDAAPVSGSAHHLVSPSARQRAKALGIDPDTVTGSGAQGSVTLADIEAAAVKVSAAVTTPLAPPGVTPGRQKEMRKAIAAAMGRSKREIPHYYLG
ncbi:MAG: biotin/lipoyl-containing protein, partial [Burkholderiaceae bacterium]